MRASQTLMLEMSEKRSELATVTETLNKAATENTEPAADDLSKAETLTREVRSMEVRYRAAVLSEEEEDRKAAQEADPDAETREFNLLHGKAKIATYMKAAMDQRMVIEGPEAELNQALKLDGGKFPLSILANGVEDRRTTDAQSTVRQEMWLDRLFAMTAADRLGVTFKSVPAGVTSVPMTTAGATFAMRERQAVAAAAPWTVGITEAKAKRGAVHCEFTVEDEARLPGLEEALLRDLREAMTEGVDRAIFLGSDAGDGNTADIVGMTTAGIQEVTVTQANKVKGPETLQAFSGMVDGIHAGGFDDLRVVAALGAWGLWETTILPAPSTEALTIGAFLRRAGLMFSSRGDIEGATAAGDFGAFVGRGMGIAGAAQACVWNSGELIRDRYTGATAGKIGLTLNYLWDFQIPRLASFQRLKFVA